MDRSDGYTGSTLSATVRQVWLAGLGALSQAGEGGEDLLRDLVHRGEEIEALGKGTAQASSPQHPPGAGNDIVEEGRLILARPLIDNPDREIGGSEVANLPIPGSLFPPLYSGEARRGLQRSGLE